MGLTLVQTESKKELPTADDATSESCEVKGDSPINSVQNWTQSKNRRELTFCAVSSFFDMSSAIRTHSPYSIK
jgi:hypothetical protein